MDATFATPSPPPTMKYFSENEQIISCRNNSLFPVFSYNLSVILLSQRAQKNVFLRKS
jgi:hypothetical protein